MTRNIYGVASAGFHAIRRLFELAETLQYYSAALALKFDMYFDDPLTGTSSKEELEVLQDALIKHLAKAGFHLRKWSSSDHSLVERLHVERLQELEVLQDALIKHLAKAGFHLRKWSSSDHSLVERLHSLNAFTR